MALAAPVTGHDIWLQDMGAKINICGMAGMTMMAVTGYGIASFD